MQYVTTRSKDKFYSCLPAIADDRALDGGLYLPAQSLVFSREEVEALSLKNPNQAVAEVLNRLFDCDLNRWSVDFAVGRYPVRLRTMNRHIAIAEAWHNQDWELSRVIDDLAALVRGIRPGTLSTGSWAQVAVRVAVLFGIFSELMRDGIVRPEQTVDVAVPSADLTAAAAALFAKSWGLPIGNIIVSCNENNNFWNLVNYGELRTQGTPYATATPMCDQMLPLGLEWILHCCGGEAEVANLDSALREGKSFYAQELTLQKLQQHFRVSVVSQNRVHGTISNVYKDCGYVFGPYSALTYAGIQDYRTKSGSDDYALLLSERGALCDDGMVAGKLNMAVSELHRTL